jgi:hypothetical protein
MDTQHLGALPSPAARPTLLPPARATLRHGQPAPLRLLAALQEAPVRAGATAGRRLRLAACLAGLAALALAGTWAGLKPRAPQLDGARAGLCSSALPAAAPTTVAPAPAPAAANVFVPTPAAARIERAAAPLPDPAHPAVVPAAPSHPPVVHAATKASLGPKSEPAGPALRGARPAAPVAQGAHEAGSAAPVPAEADLAQPARPPQVEAAGVVPQDSDPDAALLEAVMHWHERHAPPPLARRR